MCRVCTVLKIQPTPRESKALKESKAVKDARKHSVTQDATVSLAIAKRSMAWSLFYNNRCVDWFSGRSPSGI
jgi:hypothetical protein